jgi:hypothetical protein
MFRLLGSILVAAMAPEGQPVGAGEVATRLGIVLALVALNAFFVAAEFALVATRRSRIENRAAAGERTARLVEKTLKDLDHYISVTQIGITIASLALGCWRRTIASLVDGGLSRLGLSILRRRCIRPRRSRRLSSSFPHRSPVDAQARADEAGMNERDTRAALMGFSMIMSRSCRWTGAAMACCACSACGRAGPSGPFAEELRLLVMQSRPRRSTIRQRHARGRI